MLGAGVEFAFTNNISGKVEYNYMDFGKRSVQFDTSAFTLTPFEMSLRQSMHLVKVGLNYHFSEPAVIAKY